MLRFLINSRCSCSKRFKLNRVFSSTFVLIRIFLQLNAYRKPVDHSRDVMRARHLQDRRTPQNRSFPNVRLLLELDATLKRDPQLEERDAPDYHYKLQKYFPQKQWLRQNQCLIRTFDKNHTLKVCRPSNTTAGTLGFGVVSEFSIFDEASTFSLFRVSDEVLGPFCIFSCVVFRVKSP